MYYVLLNGEIAKTFDTIKIRSLVKSGFYVCKSYIDAVVYSRAILARGTKNKINKNYFEIDKKTLDFISK